MKMGAAIEQNNTNKKNQRTISLMIIKNHEL